VSGCVADFYFNLTSLRQIRGFDRLVLSCSSPSLDLVLSDCSYSEAEIVEL